MAETRQIASRIVRQLSVAGCVCLYAGAFVMTHLPPGRVPGAGLINDKVLHFTGYAGLGIASLWTHFVLARGVSGPGRFFGVWALMLCYALMDEWTQPYVGRSFEWSDLAADALGALVGLSAATLIVRRRV
ncbi:MAG: VanZ family protein [Phycisphaerales bacterium]|nr:VanZ family protein [Phycisphaerales bacterium]MCB9857095.1 VanZ family protein [Phycisphaerales bacterium]MCB9861778.1 VanZ family protein [Phycisphaerales bacterium]